MSATVICADMRTIEWTHDPERAVVVTDPPFGFGGKGFTEMPWADAVLAALAVPARRHVIRGPASHLIGRDHPQPRRLHVEVASFARAGSFRPRTVQYRWHGWLIYGSLRVGLGPRSDAAVLTGSPYVKRSAPGADHRGITPLAAVGAVLTAWTEPDDLVIDPFAGRGGIGLVCTTMRRDYLGVEIDPQWAAEAAARVDHEQLDLDIGA